MTDIQADLEGAIRAIEEAGRRPERFSKDVLGARLRFAANLLRELQVLLDDELKRLPAANINRH